MALIGIDQLVSAYGTVARARKAIFTPAGVNGTLVESAWILAHLVLYPLGILEETARDEANHHSVSELSPVQRGMIIGDVAAAGTPIILVHGVVDNRSIFTFLRRALRRRGFGRTILLNYSPFSDDIRAVAYRLADLIEEVCHETGYERVHIVGHSMGGLVARYYVQRLDGHERVHTVVTLGTPNNGTRVADFVPHPLARQMRPGSELIAELNEPVPGCDTRFVSIWTDLDQSIIPKQNAKLTIPGLRTRNVFIRGVGHMSLPVDGRVIYEITNALAQLDHEGHTIANGATSINSTVA